MRKLVISDIHGAFKALEQVLERSKFDPEVDTLIMMGDICDGWKYTTECIDLLNTFPNLIHLLGNHDFWCLEWLRGRKHGCAGLQPYDYIGWMGQGGQATISSMMEHDSFDRVFDFLESALPFYIDDQERLFVHGGIDPNHKAEDEPVESLIWNRTMVKLAQGASMGTDPVIPQYSQVFCGHTPTLCFGDRTEPIHYSNVWLCDTGASYDGPLTIMDIDSNEFWQSDPVVELYPNEKAR